MAETLLMPLADAFMEVGVFCAVLIAAFGWLRWRHGDRLLAFASRTAFGPTFGAVMGVFPGCATTIMVMPLYCRGTVSFGTVIAALVATMGDSSWVIMAADPEAALLVHAILFATGLVSGYVVDALGIEPRHRPTPAEVSPGVASPSPSSSSPAARPRPVAAGAAGLAARTAAPVVTPGGALALPRTMGPTAAAFWLLAGGGIVIAFPVAFQLVDPAVLTSGLGGLDPYLAVGLCGTAVAAVIAVHSRLGLADDSLATVEATAGDQPFGEVLRHGAKETSFVVVWVAAIYLAWGLVHTLTGFDGSQLPVAGFVGVLVGAAVGLIPGCAVQIVFTGLFISGVVPLSTLTANALSQDGDALLPLIAGDHRSAALAAVVTTVPGLLVGSLVLLLT